MPIKLTKRTEEEIAESVREGDFESADQVVHEGIALLRARQEFRRAVEAGAAAADRGELLDGQQVFTEIKARLGATKRRLRK
jgi:Arc/MetJ-type ribon-helix-helix transcriptional regulator